MYISGPLPDSSAEHAMTSWSDYSERARGKGVLAKQLFMVRSRPAVSLDELARGLFEHLEYQRLLEKQGILVFAGPLSDESGSKWSGEGLIIYRAADLVSAKEIADADPMHREGLRKYEIRAWLLNEGSLTLRITLSDQKLELP